MKFGKRWEKQVHEPWISYYIDYLLLKKELKKAASEGSNDQAFLEILMRDLKKANSFYKRKERELWTHLQEFESSTDNWHNGDTLFHDFCKTVDTLRFFVVLNYMAVYKIIKKRNKVLASKPPMDFKLLLLEQHFYTSDGVGKLTVRTELLGLKRLGDSQVEPKKEDYSCPICLEVLCNPVVLSCAHRFCWSCLSSSSSWMQACPVCMKDHLLEPQNLSVDWLLKQFLQEHFPSSQKENSPIVRSKQHVIERLESKFPKTSKKTQRIVQFTDLHHFNNGSKEDQEGIELMASIVDRVDPDLVVLSGDIIDGRHCGSHSCFSKIVAPFIERGIPWTFVPGNHDDETEVFTRQDLLSIYSLPFCASRNKETFTHSLELGPMQVYMIDSNAYIDRHEDHPTYDYIHHEQIEWYKEHPSTGEVGVAFFHIPIVEYKKARVLIGSKGEEPCTPKYNSGFFQAIQQKRDIQAMFTGHDHWNDFVAELDDVWMGYGRVTGSTAPSIYSDFSNVSKCPFRGGRVVEYDPTTKQLSTWIENERGTEENTLLVKTI